MMTRNREAHGSAKSKPCQVPAPCQSTSGSPSPAVSIATLTPLTEIDSRWNCMIALRGCPLVMPRGANNRALSQRFWFGLARHDNFRKPRVAFGLPARAFPITLFELRQDLFREQLDRG